MKRIILAGIIAVALITGAEAQDQTGTILGFVVSEGSLAAVEGAYIVIVPGYDTAQTNGVGSFLLSDVAYGSYMVLIVAEGYQNTAGLVTVNNPFINMFTTAMTPVATPVEGEVASMGSLTGLVINSQTLAPIVGANIALTPGNASATTSDFGAFFLDELTYDTYTLQVTADGYENFTETVKISSLIPTTVNIMMTPVQTEGEPALTGSIAGFVLDSTTLAPVSYASLLLTPGDIAGTANGFGAFVFTNVAYGSYDVQVTAPGYSPNTAQVSVSNPAVNPMEILLTPETVEPTGSIAGIVTRSDFGIPAAGVTVTLLPDDISVETNAFGGYAFTGLSYGLYTVTFSADGFVTHSEPASVGSTDLITISIALAPEATDPVGRITGMVSNAWTFEAIEGATVTLSPGGTEVLTGPMGGFLFENIAYGEYTVQVTADGFQNASETVQVDTAIGTAVAIALTPVDGEPTGSLSGLVRDAVLQTPIENATLTLTPGGQQDQTNALGAFQFNNLVYGEYTVEVAAAGHDNASRVVQLNEGIVIIDIPMTPTGFTPTGSIGGAVTDAITSLPIADAQITLMPGARQTQTNILGLFAFDDLDYGDYVVGATASGYLSGILEVTVDSTIPVAASLALQPGEITEGEGEPTEGEGEATEGEGELGEGEGETIEGEGENIEGEGEASEGEGETIEGEGEVTEGEGEPDPEEPTGCCRCQNKDKSFDWRFLLKEYWLIGAALVGMALLDRRKR
jgi:large repetitive protein